MAESAGSVSVELIAKTEAFDRQIAGSATVTEQAMTRVINATSRGEQQVVRSAGQIANGTRNLGRQFADVGASLAGGSSPFIVLAQQAPQVAEALDDMGGKAGRVAAFFTGPWGAALLAAGSVLGVLASEAFKAGDSVEDLVSKLEKQARQTAQNEAAQYQFSQTTAGLTIAVRDLGKALDQQNASSQRAAFLTLAKANADREATIQARRRAASEYALAVALASNAKSQNIFAGGPGGAQSLVAAQYGAQEEQARRNLAKAENNVAEAQRNVVRAQAPIIRGQVAEAHDNAARAAGRYERQLDLLYSKLRRGQITEAQYREGVDRATTNRDALLNADRSSGRRGTGGTRRVDVRVSASREAQRGLEAEDKAAADLTRRYEALQAKYDPAAAAAREFKQVMEDIADLRLSGTISEGEALRLQIAAIGVEAKRADEEMNKLTTSLFGDPSKDLDNVLADINAERDARIAAQDDVENRLRDRRARDIDDLAYFYESAFNGGVDDIWDTFKREGFRAIALVLARLTLGESFAASLGGGEGGGAGAIGKLLSFIPGFASGGSMLIGGNPGVDRNTLSLNGQPIAKVSRGETLGIANQAANSRPVAPQQPVIIQLSADEGSMFVPRVEQISGGAAVRVVQATAPGIVRGASRQTQADLVRSRSLRE